MLLDDSVIDRAKCKGFLKKQGGKWKTWKNRYFVLDDNTLYYLESPKDREPLGVIYLLGLVIEGAEQETKWKWSFSMTTKTSTSVQTNSQWQERRYVIQANDEKDYKMWLDALRNAVFQMKQSAVSVKDAPSSAHSHVKGSKPAAKQSPDPGLNRVKHLSRASDPSVPLHHQTLVNNNTSNNNSNNNQQNRNRVFSENSDKFNNRASIVTKEQSEYPKNNGATPQGDVESSRAKFRKSVFEKAVNGLFETPGTEPQVIVEDPKDKKPSLLGRLSLRGSGNINAKLLTTDPRPASPQLQAKHDRSEIDTSDPQPSPPSHPASWERGAISLYDPSFFSAPTSSPSPSPPTSSPLSPPNQANTKHISQSFPPSTTRTVFVAPWSDIARDTVFSMLKIKASNSHYSSTNLRIRIMATAVNERIKEELVTRGVEVFNHSWDDEQAMQSALANIQKVLFLPGNSQASTHWAASIIKATRAQPKKIVQFVRLGVAGMGQATLLGQWGQAVDTMCREEGITTTTVLVDQTYQDIVPMQSSRSSTPFVVPAFVAPASISPVDARDLSMLLGTILLGETPQICSNITVQGPETLTYTHIANTMNQMLNLPLTFSPYPPQNAVLREVYEVFKNNNSNSNSGEKRNNNNERIESVIGRPLCTFERYLNECILKRS